MTPTATPSKAAARAIGDIAKRLWADHIPTPFQWRMLCDDSRLLMVGGEAGVGKDVYLLMEASKYLPIGAAALLIRRTYSDLSLEGGLIPVSAEWWGDNPDFHWDGKAHRWTYLPTGGTVSFGYLDSERAHYRYKSSQVQMVGINESTDIPETQIRYLNRSLRRTAGSKIPIRFRLATNPGGISEEYHIERFVDPDTRGEDAAFYPAFRADNPHLDAEDYEKSLSELDSVEYRRQALGEWGVVYHSGYIDVDNIEMVDALPDGVVSSCRIYDTAASLDGDRTAGARMHWLADGRVVVDDVHYGRWMPGERDAEIYKRAKLDRLLFPAIRLGFEKVSNDFEVDMRAKFRPLRPLFVHHEQKGKVERAQYYAGAVRNGKVVFVRGKWNYEAHKEQSEFPEGNHDDIVDTLSYGYQWLRDRNNRRTKARSVNPRQELTRVERAMMGS